MSLRRVLFFSITVATGIITGCSRGNIDVVDTVAGGSVQTTVSPSETDDDQGSMVYVYDEQKRIKTITDSAQISRSCKSQLDDEGKQKIINEAKALATENISFGFEIKTELLEMNDTYTVKVYENTGFGFETANLAMVNYLGDGTFLNASFSYDDTAIAQTGFIDEIEAYDTTLAEIKNRFSELGLHDYSQLDDESGVRKVIRDGKYIYYVDIYATYDDGFTKDYRTLFTGIINAQTGELMGLASEFSR